MNVGRVVVAAAVALALGAPPARAANGIVIALKSTTGNTVSNSQVQIDNNRMRTETIAQNGRKQIAIFDGNAQVLRMLDEEAKTYQEMTKDDVERIGNQMNAAIAQMQERMQNMSPEQRARVEALMQGRGRGAAVQTEYRKAGTDKVGKWTCDKYEGFRDGKKVSELCTVSPSAIGFTPADFQVTTQLAEFFSKMVPQSADRLFRMGTGGPAGFSGIPVRGITYGGDGSVIMMSEVTDATRQSIPESTFAVPPGFEKRELPMGRGRGRGRGLRN